MKSRTLWILLWLSILAGGLLLRVTGLKMRPMHTDEAVHAYKFMELLEDGFYRYDPLEYHGPVLNYCTLASAYLRGERTSVQIDEATLRLIPAVFGTLLILTPLFFVRDLGRRAVFFVAVLIAFSPAFVYYSRYYIQEMLLVFFTACFIGTVRQYQQRQTAGWLVLAGVFLGLMHASKETFIFSLAAGAVAVLIVIWRCGLYWPIRPMHIAAGAGSFLIVSFSLFSSFGSNPGGILDSFTTYGAWIQRAGTGSVHAHPWFYYLDLVTWMEFFEPLTWNEDGIAALALLGVVCLFAQKRGTHPPLVFFFVIYTVLLTLIYSVIPYKTPWSMLSFFYGMAVVAGFAGDHLLKAAQQAGSKAAVVIVLLIFGLISPVVQSKLLAFDYASDPANPYVYAHTGTDIYGMVRDVKQAAYASGQGTSVPIQVIAGHDDYWPLPWYLREFSKVGYWNHVDASAAGTPIILMQAQLEQPLLETVYSASPPGQKSLYFPLFESGVFLRPGIPWQGCIRKDLWDKMQRESQDSSPQNKGALMDPQSNAQEIPDLHRFSHQAMNTTFGVIVQHSDEAYAMGAARAAFREADRLEGLFSRFIENSDISRINAAAAGQSVVVDEDTMQCLLTAQRAFELTGGAFDINFAGRAVEQTGSAKAFELHPESHRVQVNAAVRLDLGGIGKGYAADKMADVLGEWSVAKAVVYAGASSVVAMDPPEGRAGWPVTFSDPQTGSTRLRPQVANEVLSCSGSAKEGHIIDPSTGRAVENKLACWIRLPQDAGLADALSTAAMVLSFEEFGKVQRNLQGCSLLVLASDNGPAEWLTLGDRFHPAP